MRQMQTLGDRLGVDFSRPLGTALVTSSIAAARAQVTSFLRFGSHSAGASPFCFLRRVNFIGIDTRDALIWAEPFGDDPFL